MIMDIDFIGLGNMGLPMAQTLLKAGHALTVYNRTRSKADGRAREGARVNMTISLAFLSPTLVIAAIDGTLPRGVGVLRDAPAEWSKQHAMLGLAS
jgi:3-hydroxyisobutyrate dehydrogenase-like beta-hydroxyacid dehydrogenase